MRIEYAITAGPGKLLEFGQMGRAEFYGKVNAFIQLGYQGLAITFASCGENCETGL